MTRCETLGATSRRLESIDILRGVAVLGILFMNVQTFAMPVEAYSDPYAFGSLEGINGVVWQWTHLLADMKFMSIFSMLFGAGIVLFIERLEGSGRPGLHLHIRRMLWLLLIGMIHAYAIWFGDILVGYALCGMLVVWLRGLPPWLLLGIGLGLAAVTSLVMLAIGGFLLAKSPEAGIEAISGGLSPSDSIAWQLESYQGGWFQQLDHRVRTSRDMQLLYFPLWLLWRGSGMMLVGMALYRWGFFSAVRSIRFYTTCLILGAGSGIPLIWWGIDLNETAGDDPVRAKFLFSQLNYWGSIPVALAWIAAVMLFVRSEVIRWFRQALAAVGRMALTNYLLQSILCSLIFYGTGLGRYGDASRGEQFMVASGICLVQLAWSPVWLTFSASDRWSGSGAV